MRRRPTRTTQRRGFSLLEILLVLAVLVVIGAMVMPTVSGPLQNHRLRKGADQIRAEWAKTRAKAMETGRTYVFRYEPQGSGYLIEPWYSDEDYLESSQVGLAGSAAGSAVMPSLALTPSASSAAMKRLPDEITFAASDGPTDVRDLIATQSPEAIQLQNAAAAENLSAPIFFYPDGTSSTTRLVIMNEKPRYVKLTLRGLTGVVYVSEPLTAERLP